MRGVANYLIWPYNKYVASPHNIVNYPAFVLFTIRGQATHKSRGFYFLGVKMEFHEYANLFPMIPQIELEQLIEDIATNGLIEPITTYENKVLDGRNRLIACQMAFVEPAFVAYTGNDPLQFVLSKNLQRRQLTAGQRAALAVDLLPYYEAEAKERQGVRTDIDPTLGKKFPNVNGSDNKATTQAAAATGTNGRYVSDAKKLQQEAPDLFEQVKTNEVNIPEAKKELKRRQKEQADSEMGGRLDMLAIEVTQKKQTVEPGQWWQLGKHYLYCGDTSQPDFWHNIPDATFAFADPPYNAGVADWDNGFNWSHDWLADKAGIVAVTPGISSIMGFAKVTAMPYKWSMSTWITNGMTRGALGFGNWIYTALFSSKESIHKNSQDFFKVSIRITGEDNHKGKKPAEYMDKLINLFTAEGDIVIDPFAGSGSTLLCCELLKRICYTGEINPGFCVEIISQFEALTGTEGVLCENAI